MTIHDRFLYYWEHVEGRSILSMPRTQWYDIAATSSQPIAVDVRSTPLANVTTVSSVIGTIVHEVNTATVRVTVYRDDPSDIPLRANRDDYIVWTDVSAHPKFAEIIKGGSSDQQTIQELARDHVFLVKQDPGPDHWSQTVPASVMLIVEPK
jgi:hypothetical protein